MDDMLKVMSSKLSATSFLGLIFKYLEFKMFDLNKINKCVSGKRDVSGIRINRCVSGKRDVPGITIR